MMEEMFTYSQAEDAMALWEAFLDLSRDDGPIAEKLRDYADAAGFSEARTWVLDQAKRCGTEYAKIADDFTGSFDWDYCPAFIHRLVEEGYFD
jgi:hypothetical protein